MCKYKLICDSKDKCVSVFISVCLPKRVFDNNHDSQHNFLTDFDVVCVIRIVDLLVVCRVVVSSVYDSVVHGLFARRVYVGTSIQRKLDVQLTALTNHLTEINCKRV